MKTKSTLRSFLIAAGSSLLAVSSASAQSNLTWDTSPGTVGAGDSAITGGTGNWNTTNGNWTNDAGANNIAWNNSGQDAINVDNAIFSGTTGTVTLDVPISLKNLTFTNTAGTYTITGSTLNFTAGTIVTNSVNNGTIIQSNITGAPAVNASALNTNEAFTFRPAASGSQSIGAITGAGGNGAGFVNFEGGAGHTSTVAAYGNTSGPKAIFNSSGTWTVTGTVVSRNVEVRLGTVVVSTGSLQSASGQTRCVALTGGTLNYNNAGAVRDQNTSSGTNFSASDGSDFVILGGSIDQTSGAAITTSTYNPNMCWGGDWTFIGSNGALSNLYLGNGNVYLNLTRQVTVTNAAATLAIGGAIQNGSGIVGNYGLTKAGAGTLELRGASTYAGATTVNAGTLKMGANNVIPDVSNVTIGSATLDADTRTDTAGTLDVTGAAVINLGTGAALAFAKSSAVDWTDIPGTLNITGTLGATSLRFGDELNQPGLAPAQLALISVNGSGTGTYVLDANGYLIPGGGDVTPPTLTSIADDVSGGPITEDASVTYTVTFSEDINSGTVSIADFDNQGTAALTINSAAETSPGVVTVVATPTTPGTLRLRIPSGAVIADTSGNNLVVPVSDDTTITVISKYEDWSGAADFDTDTNGDGVKNGLAFLLGAANKNDNALSLLPEVTESGGGLVMTFDMLDAASRGTATLSVEHSSDLGIGDPWEAALVPDVDDTVNDVVFDISGSGPLGVEATIPSSKAAGGKLFGRLKAVQTP